MARLKDEGGIGAGAGAVVGSVFPGVGTAIGGAIGGAVEKAWRSVHKDWTQGKTLQDVCPNHSGSLRKRDYDIVAHYANTTADVITKWQMATRGRRPDASPCAMAKWIKKYNLSSADVNYIFTNQLTFAEYATKKKQAVSEPTAGSPTTAKAKKSNIGAIAIPLLGYFLFKGK